MKKLIFLCIFVIISFRLTYSQGTEDDPLADSYIIHDGVGEEIAAIEMTYEEGIDYVKISLYKYFKEMEYAPWDTVINVLSYLEAIPTYYSYSDMTIADLDSNGLNEIVAVWTKNTAVEIALLQPNPDLLGIDTLASWQKVVRLQKSDPALFSSDEWHLPEAVFVKTGNFDTDPEKEFVIAYWADDGNGSGYANLTVYDVSDSLVVVEKGSIMDQPIIEPPLVDLCEDQMFLFEIECADLNGDGIDEIVLAGREPRDPFGWQIFINVYSYNAETGQLVAQVSDDIYI